VAEEWIVFSIFAKSALHFEKIVDAIKPIIDSLMKTRDLKDYYYNLYFIQDEKGDARVEPHVKYGLCKLKKEKRVLDSLKELEAKGLVTRFEKVAPDLRDGGGVPIDQIKLTSRKITELVKTELGQNFNPSQAYYLIHLAMNPLMGYVSERETYLLLTAGMEDAIRKHSILPKEQWLQFLDEYLEKHFPRRE
jgi:hypothetical protein